MSAKVPILVLVVVCLVDSAVSIDSFIGDRSGFVKREFSQLFLTVNNQTIRILIYASNRNAETPDDSTNWAFAVSGYFQLATLDNSAPFRVVWNDARTVADVTLRLLLIDEGLTLRVAEHLSTLTGKTVLHNKIGLLPFEHLEIQDSALNLFASLDSIPNTDSWYAKFTKVPGPTVQKLLDESQNNELNFVCKGEFSGSGSTKNSITVTTNDVISTTQFRQRFDDGAKHYIAADQLYDLSLATVSRIQAREYLENSDPSQLINRVLQGLISQVITHSREIKALANSFVKALKKEGIDLKSKDFDPDVLITLRDQLVHATDFSSALRVLTDVSAKVGVNFFELFGGDAEAHVITKSELDTAIRTYYSRDWNGKSYSTIPKTIRIHELDSAALTNSETVLIDSVRVIPLSSAVSTLLQQVFPHEQLTATPLGAGYVNLLTRVATLEKQLLDAQAALSKLDQRALQYMGSRVVGPANGGSGPFCDSAPPGMRVVVCTFFVSDNLPSIVHLNGVSFDYPDNGARWCFNFAANPNLLIRIEPQCWVVPV